MKKPIGYWKRVYSDLRFVAHSWSLMGWPVTVGPGGEFGTKPKVGQTPPEPRRRIVGMALTQACERERACRTVGVEKHSQLAGGRGSAQQLDQHAFCLGVRVFSQRSHGSNLREGSWDGKNCLGGNQPLPASPEPPPTNRPVVALLKS